MNQIVPVTQKRAFIRWLLDHHLLKNRETVWLFNYLMGSDQLLGLIHFAEHVAGCTRAITISSSKQENEVFKYTKENVTTPDPEKAFHDLRLDQEEAVYIKIALPSVAGRADYLAVLEETPHDAQSVHDTYGKAAENAAKAAEKAYAEQYLYREINHALDRGDKETFYRLTDELKKLQKEHESF